ncbi:MAG: hypothetical protein JW936_05770 [Sedimentisphaerales bacterium]|nr:hypothetical protein [Sedimentisphaerales bacterium]
MKTTDQRKQGKLENTKTSPCGEPVEEFTCQGDRCPVLDKALVLLLDREESILGDIVKECNELVSLANAQAMEMADYLDEQA